MLSLIPHVTQFPPSNNHEEKGNLKLSWTLYKIVAFFADDSLLSREFPKALTPPLPYLISRYPPFGHKVY